MKASILLFFLACYSLVSFASSDPFYVTSKKAIEMADSLIELNEYDKAKEILKKVNENDTAFVECLYKLAYVNYIDSSYEKCANVCKRAIQINGVSNDDFYNLMGLSFSLRNEYDQAISIFKEAISKYPTYYLFYYNLGNAFKGKKEYNKALSMYSASIELNPFYSPNYFQLVYLLGSAKHTTAASMACLMYLLIDPTGSQAANVVYYLDDIIKKEQDWDQLDVGNMNYPSYFSEIDIILENKVALNKQYKLKTDIDYELMRQSQVLLEKIPSIRDTSFWHQRFGNILSLIWSSDNFEGFSYYMLQGVDNEEINSLLQKKKSDIEKFKSWAVEDLVPELRLRLIKEKKAYKDIRSMYYGNNVLYGRGQYDRKNEKDIGDWIYYHPNSIIVQTGSYNKEGNKDGPWNLFHNNGNIEERLTYADDKIVGPYEKFNREGILIQDYNYDEEGVIQGKVHFYNELGCLDEELSVEDGQREGKSMMYYDAEHVKGMATYKENAQVGPYYELYANGDSSEVSMVGEKGYFDGLYRSFWRHNVLYAEGNYAEGDKEGKWTYWHRNGKKMKEGEYKKGKPIGTWNEYYSNGNMESEKFLDESGKENGEVKKYDFDGKLHEMYTYKSGVIMAYKYYDKQGSLIDSYDKKNNELLFKGYNALGQVSVEGKFIKEGRDGHWKFYSPNGQLNEETHYKEGMAEGARIFYHENGEIESSYILKNDMFHGNYESKDSYGHLLSKGYYFEDKLEGEFYSFSKQGDTMSKKYYHKGELKGRNYFFDIDGKADYLNIYKNGYIEESMAFDGDGQIFDSSKLDNGNGVIKYYHPNRVLNVELTFLCGLINGYAKYYNGLSQLIIEGEYFRGDQIGLWKWYNEEGEISTIGNFEADEKNGRWLYYQENGTLSSVEHYEFGEKVGVDSSFHDNGNVYTVENHQDGKRHGRTTYYNRTGEIYMVKEFFEGDVVEIYGLHGDKKVNSVDLKQGDGKVEIYYANGNKSFSATYKKGVYSGKLEAFHSNGSLWKRMTISDGNLENEYLEYYENGNKMENTNYLYDERNGLYSHFDENGNLDIEMNYKNDDRHGVGNYYQDGKLINSYIFYEDEILSEN